MEGGGIARAYGYAVCLIAVVAVGFGAITAVNGTFAYLNPLTNATWNGASLASYDAFRSTYRFAQIASGENPGSIPADQQLRAEYETRRSDTIAAVHVDGLRTTVGGVVLIVAALIVFRFHWRWLQHRGVASSWS